MARQTNTSSKKHSNTLPDGRIGCYQFGCDAPATRWLDMERYGCRRWLTTSYCDSHGLDLQDPHHTYRIRPIR